jgi:hypothetical protein
MMITFPLDEQGVYRVRVPSDDEPEPRLCIKPRMVGRALSFWDTLRERRLEGKFINDKRAAADAKVFQVNDGERLFLEPLTLARWDEIRDRIDGRPVFASEDELLAFYRDMVD